MTDKRFPDVPGGYPFPELELEMLGRWKERRVFAKSLEKNVGGREFVFYEGPPTANNRPHVGHVVTRSVKDVFPRFRTMRGEHVARKAGWDTHGLPVEIEVEKRLGFSGKQDIEKFGVEKFNAECLKSVHTYERQWAEMTERVGFWVDLDDAYFTYTNRYIESVWWALAELFKKGLLTTGYKIQPYCARCGTTLSSHEVAQNYKDTEDPSVWVRFPVRPGPKLETLDGGEWSVPEGLDLVAWTTTPWTLLGHTGLAVNTGLDYRVVEHPAEPGKLLLFGEDLATAVPVEIEGENGRRRMDLREAPAVARLRGEQLVGLRYDRPFATLPDRVLEGGKPFDPAPSDAAGWRVFGADYVTATEGTGLVHTAPAFGEDDYASGLAHNLPFILSVDGEGKIDERPGTEPFAGLWFKDADKKVRRALLDRGLLLHSERYHHNYPFCWRCDQPLLYYASVSWFVRTTEPGRKRALVEKNREEIRWQPAHVGEGRFGNWLENVVDWALSRRRYWGTPLPIWVCDRCDHQQAIGSFQQLFEAAGRELPADPYDREQFDPHRPYVDRDWREEPFTWSCESCGEGRMGRVEEVIDAWFDSGAMPFAQHHYLGEPTATFDPPTGRGFPADFISEAIDQTRGWFYTLHVLGVLLFDSAAYSNCIVLGHINDEQGRKMSKRLGNVVEPMAVLAETGADALRWYFYITNPEMSARFSARLVREAAQKFLLPLWNALSFFTIYANLDGWRPTAEEVPFAERPALDRWIELRLDRLTEAVTESLEAYSIVDAARELELFVDDLTNWYIRRSRDRFWAPAESGGRAKESAYQTLYGVFGRLSRLIAPFTPFVADQLHGHLVRSQGEGAESVHLEDWPAAAAERADAELLDGMAAVQRIVRLGHAARNEHGLKTRQPLASVTLVTTDPALPELVAPQADLLRDELNVREIRWAADRSVYVHHEVRPVFPKCGPRFGKQMRRVKEILEAADGDALAAELETAGRVAIDLDGESVELDAEEVDVRLIERQGTATQGDSELLVALDTGLTPELIGEGHAREIIHRVQSARKRADLDYADRIRVIYRAAAELEPAIAAHRDWIARETLATEVLPAPADAKDLTSAPLETLEFALKIDLA